MSYGQFSSFVASAMCSEQLGSAIARRVEHEHNERCVSSLGNRRKPTCIGRRNQFEILGQREMTDQRRGKIRGRWVKK